MWGCYSISILAFLADSLLKKREGVPEMGTKPLKALGDIGPLIKALKGSNGGSGGFYRGSKSV